MKSAKGGNYCFKDLEWGKYSVLQKYADAKGVLHHAYTTAVRNAAKDADLSELDGVSETLSSVGRQDLICQGEILRFSTKMGRADLGSTSQIYSTQK